MYHLTINTKSMSKIKLVGAELSKLLEKVKNFIKENPFEYTGQECKFEEK